MQMDLLGPQLHHKPYTKPPLQGAAALLEPEGARSGAGMVPTGDRSQGRATRFSRLEPFVLQHPGGVPAKPRHFPLQSQHLTRLL